MASIKVSPDAAAAGDSDKVAPSQMVKVQYEKPLNWRKSPIPTSLKCAPPAWIVSKFLKDYEQYLRDARTGGWTPTAIRDAVCIKTRRMAGYFTCSSFLRICKPDEVSDERIYAFLASGSAPTVAVKNDWSARMSKVVKGSLKYVEGSDPYWVFMRAVALLDDEMESSGLNGWRVDGTTDSVIKSKDLALLLAQELPSAQKQAVIKVIPELQC